MQPTRNLYRSERGAIFVQVAVAVFVLMAMNVFVIDYGMMWVGRRQAQNAADAGAIAGAVARAYDDFDSPPTSGGVAGMSAQNVALATANEVWRQPVVPQVSFACPPGVPVTSNCVQVDVFRDAAHSNAIGTLFGPILSITGHDVRATASAIVRSGNAVECLRPMALADAWVENTGNTEFNRYDASGSLLSPADVYIPPSSTVSGNTTVPADLGERIIWTLDLNPLTTPITRNTNISVTLPTPGSVHDHIKHCSPDLIHIGQTLPLELPIPIAGDIDNALWFIINLYDPTATWNESDHRIENSCAPSCAPVSPRLVPVPLFDPDKFQKGRATGDWPSVGCPSANPCITVTNIVGFFVHGTFLPYGPHGHFLRYPGQWINTAPTLVDDASWLVFPQLVR